MATHTHTAAKRIDRDTPLNELPQYLTVEEMARVLGIGRGLAYELAKADPRFKAVRLGRLVRIPREAIAALIHQGQ